MVRLFIFIVFISFIACKNNNETDKKFFRYNEPGGISSLDPAFARNVENIWATNQLFNGLVQMNQNLEVVPCIAKKWAISDDGLTYTFTLRNDVFFHKNESITTYRKVVASDFEYSFKRIINPNIASPGAWIFNYLDKSESTNFLGFKALNDSTFEVKLKQPFPPFLGILTMQYCTVVSPEAVEYFGSDFRRNPVGTGAFQFKMWEEGSKLVFVKNEDYFETDDKGKQLPYIDGVAISFVKDRQLAFLDFTKKKYDFMSGLEASFRDKVFTKNGELHPDYQGEILAKKLPYLKTDYIGILIDDTIKNEGISHLKIKKLRQALNYAFDREKMVKYLRNTIGTPALGGFVPKGIPSYDTSVVKGYNFNPDLAKKLIEEAGLSLEKLPQITLSTTIDYQDLCEYMQHEYDKIGISAKVEVLDESTFREMASQSKMPIFKKSWVADYPDAENFLALFYSKNFCPKGPNYTHFKNSEFDRLYEQSMQENNFKKRQKIYQEMDKIIVEEAPVIPLYYDEVVHLQHFNIEGLEENPMNILSLKKLMIK